MCESSSSTQRDLRSWVREKENWLLRGLRWHWAIWMSTAIDSPRNETAVPTGQAIVLNLLMVDSDTEVGGTSRRRSGASESNSKKSKPRFARRGLSEKLALLRS